MSKRAVATQQAPAAIGPYSQGIKVKAGTMLFISGQIPLDADSGELVGKDDVQAQTRKVMQNLVAVLAAGGADMSDVVRCTIFLTDLGDFSRVNDVYEEFFRDAPPSRACVEVAALPKGVDVEIDAIAVVDA